MNIALVHNLPSGGAKRHTREQLRQLVARGHQIVEFAPSSADSEFTPFTPYLRERRTYAFAPVASAGRVPMLTPYLNAAAGLRTLARMDALSRRMARDIDAGGFDLAFVKDCQLVMNPYILRYLKTRSVFQCHHGLRHRVENAVPNAGSPKDYVKRTYYAPARAMFRTAFRNAETANIRGANVVLTNSKFSAALIRANYGVTSRVIYPGIDTELFKPQQGSKEPYVVCVAALIHSKGYRFLVEALGRIPPATRPPLRIIANSVVADEERQVRQRAAEVGVQVQIETIRQDRELVEAYSRATVFVYAPEQEALGMAPLEALACGTPVVAVAEGGVLETVLDGTTGILVGRDPDAFANALGTMLADHSLRTRLATAGIEDVRKRWTWSSAVDRLEEAFSAVTDQ